MCENCMNQGCKYRGYNCDWHNPPEQFEWVEIGDVLIVTGKQIGRAHV